MWSCDGAPKEPEWLQSISSATAPRSSSIRCRPAELQFFCDVKSESMDRTSHMHNTCMSLSVNAVMIAQSFMDDEYQPDGEGAAST